MLIRTQERLQMFHLQSGTDVLNNPELSTYLHSMHFKFGNGAVDPDSVYLMNIDKAIYDINDPAYLQTHCLRFELDRSTTKGSRAGGLKITDVDFWL